MKPIYLLTDQEPERDEIYLKHVTFSIEEDILKISCLKFTEKINLDTKELSEVLKLNIPASFSCSIVTQSTIEGEGVLRRRFYRFALNLSDNKSFSKSMTLDHREELDNDFITKHILRIPLNKVKSVLEPYCDKIKSVDDLSFWDDF